MTNLPKNIPNTELTINCDSYKCTSKAGVSGGWHLDLLRMCRTFLLIHSVLMTYCFYLNYNSSFSHQKSSTCSA